MFIHDIFIQSLRAFRRAAPSALNSDGDCFCTSCMGHLHPYTSWMITLHLIEVLENPVSVPAVWATLGPHISFLVLCFCTSCMGHPRPHAFFEFRGSGGVPKRLSSVQRRGLRNVVLLVNCWKNVGNMYKMRQVEICEAAMVVETYWKNVGNMCKTRKSKIFKNNGAGAKFTRVV